MVRWNGGAPRRRQLTLQAAGNHFPAIGQTHHRTTLKNQVIHFERPEYGVICAKVARVPRRVNLQLPQMFYLLGRGPANQFADLVFVHCLGCIRGKTNACESHSRFLESAEMRLDHD